MVVLKTERCGTAVEIGDAPSGECDTIKRNVRLSMGNQVIQVKRRETDLQVDKDADRV